MSRDEMERRMAVLLGGRAAEMLVFDTPSTGAADDLAKATDLARSIVARFGMSEGLGLVAYEADQQAFLGGPFIQTQRNYSEQAAREIDCAVRALVGKAFETALGILTEARRVLERGARMVLEKETLGEPDLAQLKESLRAISSLPDVHSPDPTHQVARRMIAVVD